MLTKEAMIERMWGPFPALREVLQEKPESTRHYGITSVSDNIFERLRRLVDIASRAEEHRQEMLETVEGKPQLGQQMCDDLMLLRRELEALSSAFSAETDTLDALLNDLWRHSRAP